MKSKRKFKKSQVKTGKIQKKNEKNRSTVNPFNVKIVFCLY